MLEQNRFLAMKKLANDIRKENEKIFARFENEPIGDAIREKDEFIESIIDNMDIAFSDGDKGKEEKQIFRANLLIPDDLEFFSAYSKDKNIRNLMNKYAVGIEDIMSKITELNLYSKYIDTFNAEKAEEKDDFVDNMIEIAQEPKEEIEEPKVEVPEEPKIDISPKEAESLLEEIEDLSNAMEELEIKKYDEPEENSSIAIEPEVIEELKPIDDIPSIDIDEPEKEDFIESFTFEEDKEEPKDVDEKEDIEEETDDFDLDVEEETESEDIEITDEIENIGSAVSEFVDEYTKVKKELEFTQAKAEKFIAEKDELRKQATSLKEEIEKLEKQNTELRERLEKTTEELSKQKEENKTLKTQVQDMEKTAKQSSDLLKEIYKSIPKKRFNVK